MAFTKDIEGLGTLNVTKKAPFDWEIFITPSDELQARYKGPTVVGVGIFAPRAQHLWNEIRKSGTSPRGSTRQIPARFRRKLEAAMTKNEGLLLEWKTVDRITVTGSILEANTRSQRELGFQIARLLREAAAD